MDSQRNILLIAFIIVCFWVWQTWQQDHAPKPPANVVHNSAAGPTSTSFDANASLPGEGQATGVNSRQITVKTDVLDVTIDTKGGDINNAALLKYTKHLGSSEPLNLLQTSPSYIYQARSGLVGPNGLDNLSPQRGGRVVYTTDKVNYVLPEGQDEIRVPLVYQTPKVTYTKTFIFKRGQYDVKVEYHIDNRTSNTLNYQMFADLKQSNELPKDLSGKSASGFGLHVYRGAAYSSDEKNYKKYDFGDIEKKNLDLESKGGWVAMLQQYFATAWVPSQNSQNTFYTLNNQYLKADQSAIGFRGEPFSVEPNSTGSVGATLWVGPEIQSQMAKIAPHLDLTVDYGWLWFISQPLFKLLKFIQSFVVNWGVAIIIITFIVRGIMYPLTKAQYTSMAKMKLLQPRIQAMRERLGGDRQRLSQEMMALYKQEKVNPLGGCFPIVIQMPIFLALFYMLSGSVELRHAPFALWIHDLSAQDPYYIMPILMGITMFLIQKMSPTPATDPMQQKLMTFMPVIFTVFFLWFPSGLVLYYIVSNLVTITQQKLIYRGLEKRGLHTREKKKK